MFDKTHEATAIFSGLVGFRRMDKFGDLYDETYWAFGEGSDWSAVFADARQALISTGVDKQVAMGLIAYGDRIVSQWNDKGERLAPDGTWLTRATDPLFKRPQDVDE